jgi:hypothetical protein
MGDSYKDCRSHRDEGLNLSQGNLKRFNLLAKFAHVLDCSGLVAGEVPRRQQGNVRREMRKLRMKLTPERLYELPNRVLHVCHKGVALLLPHEQKL